MRLPRFRLDEEDAFRAFLKEHPRAIVLYRGDTCPYSGAFEPSFHRTDAPEGWAACVRFVEEGGHGPVAEALGVHVTPTVGAWRDGAEVARLEATILVGLSRAQYRRWLATFTS